MFSRGAMAEDVPTPTSTTAPIVAVSESSLASKVENSAPFDPVSLVPAANGDEVVDAAAAVVVDAASPKRTTATELVEIVSPTAQHDKYWERPKSSRELTPAGAPATSGEDDAANESFTTANVMSPSDTDPVVVVAAAAVHNDDDDDDDVDDDRTLSALEDEEDEEEDEGGEPDGGSQAEVSRATAADEDAPVTAQPDAPVATDDDFPPVRPVVHTEKPCDSYELDMEAAAFNTCKWCVRLLHACGARVPAELTRDALRSGHKKTAHSTAAQETVVDSKNGGSRRASNAPVWAGGAKPSQVSRRESGSARQIVASPPKDMVASKESDTDLL